MTKITDIKISDLPFRNHTLETRQLSVRRILATALVVTMTRHFPETLHNYSTLSQKDK